MATAAHGETPTSEEQVTSYTDFMVVGKTGQGKSTLSNLILGIDPDKKYLLETSEAGEGDVIRPWECNADDKPYFETGDGPESVTKHCKLLSNEKSMNRVLDTIGFADDELTKKYGTLQGNIQIFRRLLLVQRQFRLRFSRIIYFLPNRGVPERADGYLQEEIEVMHSYFGTKIFDIMVIAVTNSRRTQSIEFKADDFERVQKVFMTAFKKIVVNDNLVKCPPVLYIPYGADYKLITDSIVSAEVISDAEMLEFTQEFPVRRSGIELKSDDRCTRCAIKILYQRMKNKALIPVKVVDHNGDVEEYDHSYCHPLFVPKHTMVARIFGGVAHIATLGTFKIVEWLSHRRVQLWPGFFDWEEICVHCKKAPGSTTCCPVNQYITIKGECVLVNHTTELDKIEFVEDIQ